MDFQSKYQIFTKPFLCSALTNLYPIYSLFLASVIHNCRVRKYFKIFKPKHKRFSVNSIIFDFLLFYA